MRRSSEGLLWGIGLLIIGLLFLLWNFGVFGDFEDTAELIIAGAFAITGLVFLGTYLFNTQDWWRIIPGLTLVAVGGIIFLAQQNVDEQWIGSLLFIAIALAFALIYLGDRAERWWALIPFGTMLVMVIIVFLTSLNWANLAVGTVLFGGMGLVFLLVYLLADDRPAFRWALIPTSVLLIIAIVTLAAFVTESQPNLEQVTRLWPGLLVVLGVLLVGLSISRPTTKPEPVKELPPEPAPEEAPMTPGASVSEVPETLQPIERAPIDLVESAAPKAPPSGELEIQPGEVEDIYGFLESAPPDESKPDPAGGP